MVKDVVNAALRRLFGYQLTSVRSIESFRREIEALRRAGDTESLLDLSDLGGLGEKACLDFNCRIEEFHHFHGTVFVKGWAFAGNSGISWIGYVGADGRVRMRPWRGLASSDLEDRFGPSAAQARFDVSVRDALPEDFLKLELVFMFEDGSHVRKTDLFKDGLIGGPHQTFVRDRLAAMFAEDGRNARVLEIGSRARSGRIQRVGIVPERMRYVGMDVLPGNGVDVVGDAHDLSRLFPRDHFDYIFSLNVFEHLIMPWKVAVEISKVLKPGGIVAIFTHHTFPLHDAPWDFWRYSDNAWHGIFNRDTGFEVVESAVGDPVRVVPVNMHAGTCAIQDQPAFVHSMVVARKTGDARARWDVDPREILRTVYPA